MSWWLFLPLSYLALGLDLVCAANLSWKEASPAFLLLMCSLLMVRSRSARTMFQVCLLGFLQDLSTGQTLGLRAAVFVLLAFLVGRLRKAEASQPLQWLWWGFPLMMAAQTVIGFGEWVLLSATVPPQEIVRYSLATVAVTFAWGAGLCLFRWTISRLWGFPRESVPRELEAGSFFLSR